MIVMSSDSGSCESANKAWLVFTAYTAALISTDACLNLQLNPVPEQGLKQSGSADGLAECHPA
jgi:hypothetical protein